MVNHITCPKCGTEIPVTTTTTGRLGRKRLDIPFKNICEALQLYQDRDQAAEKLGCSVAYIYNACKGQGTNPKEVMEGKRNKIGQLVELEGNLSHDANTRL